MIPAHIAKELHRSRTPASDWLLARYKKEGVEEPKDRHKSGRQSKLPLEIAVKIKKKLKESKQGWTTTKQDFRKRVGHYFRTKRFNLNMRNYLAGHMSEDIY